MDKNAQVIKNAIARFKMERDEIVREGMIRLAKAGLEYLVFVHNNFDLFEHHVSEDDTMAWAVAKDGKLVASGSHSGGEDDMPGDAKEKAESIAREHSDGWVAIILSDMDGFYNETREKNDFLFDTSFNTASEFQTYFKRIDK